MNPSVEREEIPGGSVVAPGDEMTMNTPANASFAGVQSPLGGQWSNNAATRPPIASDNNGQVQIQVAAEESENSADGSRQRGREVREAPQFSPRRLDKTLLVMTSQGGLGLFAGANSGSLSPNGVLLLHFAVACNILGFLCCLYSLLLNARKPGIARLLTGAGCVATVYGYLLVMGMILLDHVMWWVIGVAFIASIPALAVFVKRTDFRHLFW